jgi:1-acyl-sn-glycerol-3-phosphate acyltransferase
VFGFTVEGSGVELGIPGPVLVLVRHTSTADTVLTAGVLANPNRLNLRYVLKNELLWDPCLDVVGRRLPNAFLTRSSAQRSGDLDQLRRLAQDLSEDEGVLLYPEGTRYSAAKAARAI